MRHASSMPLTLQQTLEGHSERVWAVSWSPVRNALASCSEDRTIRIWESKTSADGQVAWECTAILDECSTRAIRDVAWSRDGRWLASASFDGTTAVWESTPRGGFEMLATLEGHENEVKACAWSPDGEHLATCGRDKSVWVWEVTDGGEMECAGVLHGHTQDVKRVRWVSPAPSSGSDRPELVSCSYDDTLRSWREDDGDWACAQVMEGHTSTVWDMTFDPASDLLASCSDDRRILVWTREGGTWRIRGAAESHHRHAILSIDFRPPAPSASASATAMLATGAADDSIRLFRVTRATSECSIDSLHEEAGAHDGDVNCVRWSPHDRTLLATCGDDGAVRLWKWADP